MAGPATKRASGSVVVPVDWKDGFVLHTPAEQDDSIVSAPRLAPGEELAPGPRPTSFEVPLTSLRGEAKEKLPASTKAALIGPDGAPLLVVLGGISGNRFACANEDGRSGWWSSIFGPQGPVGEGEFRVLGIDFVADETGAFAPTTLDQTAIIRDSLAVIGEGDPFALVGASYGGMVALAYAQEYRPSSRLIIFGAGAEPHAMATAARSLQRQVVALGIVAGKAEEALAIARAMGMTTYRTPREFADRFKGGIDNGDPLSSSEPWRYLSARGAAFINVMSPGRFLSLSGSIDRHRIDPAAIGNDALVIACTEDQVAPLQQCAELAAKLGGNTRFRVIESIYGHDSFLTEPERVGALIREFLDEAR
ncbi:MAG: alpha/beta fold hydrolase [Sphingomicrobium sp.]